MEVQISDSLIDYQTALTTMEKRVNGIIAGTAAEKLWLLEHQHVYTAGTSANDNDLLSPDKFPVYKTGRGGEYTYHGPGQRVGYVMIDLKTRTPDLHHYIHTLEQWIINTLLYLDIKGERREGRIGIWVKSGNNDEKIAALGVRVRKWVTFHGIALNVHPDLGNFAGIVPCGIRDHGVTSLHKLGCTATLKEVDHILIQEFKKIF